MIYVLLVILTSSMFNILFKIFERLGVNTLQAIMFNYIAATICSWFIIPTALPLSEVVSQGWFYTGIFLGVSYFVSMYFYSISTLHLGMALTSLITRASLVVPATVSLFLFNEAYSWNIGVAIALIIFALYFIFYVKGAVRLEKRNIVIMYLLPVVVFLFCAVNDLTIKISQFFYIRNEVDNASFMLVVYITSLIFSTVYYIVYKSKNKVPFTLKASIGGLLMGVVNVVNSFSILKALTLIPASKVFPIVNIGIVLFSTVIGLWLFKEKLTRRKIIGMIIALVAIALLS